MNRAAILCILFSSASALRINTHKKLHYTYLSHQNDNADNGYHSAYLSHKDPKLAMRQKVDMESQARTIMQLVHKKVEKDIMFGDFSLKAWAENSGMKEMTKLIVEDPDVLKIAEQTSKSYDTSKFNSYLEKSFQEDNFGGDPELAGIFQNPDVQALGRAVAQAYYRHPTEQKRLDVSFAQLKTKTLFRPENLFHRVKMLEHYLFAYNANMAIASVLLSPGSPMALLIPGIVIGQMLTGTKDKAMLKNLSCLGLHMVFYNVAFQPMREADLHVLPAILTAGMHKIPLCNR